MFNCFLIGNQRLAVKFIVYIITRFQYSCFRLFKSLSGRSEEKKT